MFVFRLIEDIRENTISIRLRSAKPVFMPAYNRCSALPDKRTGNSTLSGRDAKLEGFCTFVWLANVTNISWRRKFGVCTIFMVGNLVTMCSIVSRRALSQSPPSDFIRYVSDTSSRSAGLRTRHGTTTQLLSGRAWNVISRSSAPACQLSPGYCSVSGPPCLEDR